MTENVKEEQGLSLMDIGPLFELVPVGTAGKTLKVFGVSAKGIFSIFQRFPEVAKWFQGGKMDTGALAKQAPNAIGAIIAAGCGFPGDEKAEKKADGLPVEIQIDVIEAIVRLTFKAGFGPFVQRIVALSNAAASQNYGRGADTTSQAASKPASPQATPPNPSGT